MFLYLYWPVFGCHCFDTMFLGAKVTHKFNYSLTSVFLFPCIIQIQVIELTFCNKNYFYSEYIYVWCVFSLSDFQHIFLFVNYFGPLDSLSLHWFHGQGHREAEKKNIFLVVRPLSKGRNTMKKKLFQIFLSSFKKVILLSYPPNPLSGRTTKKKYFFCGFPKTVQNTPT